MDFFRKAKTVRLRSHHDKYLHADPDEETVTQDRDGSTPNSHWTVEPVPALDHVIRVKSCYNRYLTASNQPFLMGVTGRKVLQTVPSRLDSSVEWEPIREGNQVKMKTRYGNFLRANGGVPPWRNSVTHDIPHRSSSWEWVLWDVEVVGQVVLEESSSLPSSDSGLFSRQESCDSYVSSPPKSEGRTIFYHVVDESADVNVEAVEGYSMVFKGNGVKELTQRLREETGLEDIVVCTRSPLNGKLCPLHLQLPPNNADMHVIVVENSSKVARDFAKIAL